MLFCYEILLLKVFNLPFPGVTVLVVLATHAKIALRAIASEVRLYK